MGGLRKQASVAGRPWRSGITARIEHGKPIACTAVDMTAGFKLTPACATHYPAAMETLRIILNLLGVVALGWLATAVMLWLMGGVIPWPYPRHWRWGWATLDAADAVPEPVEGRFAKVDWLDQNLRRN